MYSYCKEQAFTLVELIITIAVLVIIISLAFPSYLNFKAKQELNHITAIIQLLNHTAKSNAVVYHSTITICSSSNATQCADDQWNTGIIMFSDRNANKQVDANETIHSFTDTRLKYGSLQWVGGATRSKILTYQGDTGQPRGSFGSFYYCSQHSPKLHRRLFLSQTGLMRFESLVC